MLNLLQDPQMLLITSQVPAIADAVSIVPLPGGLTNNNYKVETTSTNYLLRISDNRTHLLGIDRANEMVNTVRAFEAGAGPELIDFLPRLNAAVISWISGETLTAEKINSDNGLLKRIAMAIKQLHAGPAFKGDFYFPDVRAQYLRTVNERQFFLPPGYKEVEPLVAALEQQLARHPELGVPCNNDLLAGNFMDDGEKIWIIDYEYAGQNEPSFEIGNMAAEVGLTNDQLALVCAVYWESEQPEKLTRATAWSMIARYGWVLWASIQEGISAIEFDFRSWGLKKWESVSRELTGPQYAAILKRLNEHNA